MIRKAVRLSPPLSSPAVARRRRRMAQSGRDYITIVGSSTVYPFTTTVAEQFGKAGKFKTPKVESTGTGGGFKLFCSGVGVAVSGHHQCLARHQAERGRQPARKAGVKDIIEVKVGYDGIVVASSNKGRPSS